MSEILETNKELTLTIEEANGLKSLEGIDSVKQRILRNKISNETFFPNKIPFNWNEDNFGPLLIPKKGMTISLTRDILPLYKKNYSRV